MNRRVSLLYGFGAFLVFLSRGKRLHADEIEPFDEENDTHEIVLVAREGTLLTGKAVGVTPGPMVRPIRLYVGDTLQISPQHPFVISTLKGVALQVELKAPDSEDAGTSEKRNSPLDLLCGSRAVIDPNGHSTLASFFYASRPGTTVVEIKLISEDPNFLHDPGLRYTVEVCPLV